MLRAAFKSTLLATIKNRSVNQFSARSFATRLEDAATRLKTLSEEPENDVKLKIYALYKQATVGDVNIPKPGSFDFVGKAKWAAWKTIEGLPKDKAEDQYVTLVDELIMEDKKSGGVQTGTSSDGFLLKTLENGVLTVRINRPDKKNSMTLKMYDELRDILNSAADDKSVKYFVFTGTGDFFSSGNDLGNFVEKLKSGADIPQMARDSTQVVDDYVKAFINFPKPMVALVNGPSIGIACTILGLFDLIYVSDSAYFQTPFSQLGLCPEGCSSFTFPRIMGSALAAEVLLMNRKLTASEAKSCGFITEVFPASSFEEECKKKIEYLSKQPPMSLMHAKALVRKHLTEDLHKANSFECERLEERFTSDEAMKAVANFFKARGQKGKL